MMLAKSLPPWTLGLSTLLLSGGLALGNSYMFGNAWMMRTWGIMQVTRRGCADARLGVSDLTPNVGMWWYFFTEMFDHFRPFFVGVFYVGERVGSADI